MYRRTGSFQRSRSSMVLSIWGGSSIDIVARSAWSRSTEASRSAGNRSPKTARSWRRFLTVWARCHWAVSHSVRVTLRKPGSLVQSGSAQDRWSG
jgi:hypothetical protein